MVDAVTSETTRDADERFRGFLAELDVEIQRVAEGALARLRGRVPGAVELVYDNDNALVVGFGPTERASDAVLSITVFPRCVSLFFRQGAGLPDPCGILGGRAFGRGTSSSTGRSRSTTPAWSR